MQKGFLQIVRKAKQETIPQETRMITKKPQQEFWAAYYYYLLAPFKKICDSEITDFQASLWIWLSNRSLFPKLLG